MKFRQHLPAFVDLEPYELEYKDFEKDVLGSPRIKALSQDTNFFRFSYEQEERKGITSQPLLMIEYDSGATWYVLGYLDEIPNLPKWDSVEAMKKKKEWQQK